VVCVKPLLLPVALLALAGVAQVATASPAPPRPDVLVVALDLSGRPFQAGAVRGREVVYATGFEPELARALARRLSIDTVRFVYVPRERLLRRGPKPWSLALARLQPGSTASLRFSAPYLEADQAVVLRRGLPRPRRLAALRRLQLCAERGSRGAAVIASRIRPSLRPLLVRDAATLVRRVQTGACDATLVEAPLVGSFVAGRRDRLGPVAGRVDTRAGYAVALEPGSRLRARVDTALRRLRADGTLARLRRGWLGADPNRIPVLR
jgi:ABC-type amino acid transport substrate-binding protein